MGNVLESDSESDEVPVPVRTAGDGMEVERNTESIHVSSNHQIRDNVKTDEVVDLNPALNTNISQSLLLKDPVIKSKKSPNQIPPLKDLIQLKPIRINKKHNDNQSIQFTQNHISPIQREPKFIPYEPYPGATRPIQLIDNDHQLHSRRNSSSSSSLPPNDNNHIIKSKESSNTTLLRERLKIGEKDIEDLRNENKRLKGLLVDSLSGGGVNINIREEKEDNLSDEIQVWRSKFLSSCVLVEQLSLEKECLSSSNQKAIEIFQNIKSNPFVQLTPQIYEEIRLWISSTPKLKLNDEY